MKKSFFTLLILVGFVFTGYAQTTITSAQTGDWNQTATWVGSVVPTLIDDVIIASGHNVTKSALGDTCSALTLNAGATLTIAATIGVMPCAPASFSSTVTGTVVYLSSTIRAAYTYGNLIFSGASGSPDGDLIVNGNLTITTATLRGANVTGVTRIHTVAGDVLLPNAASRISGVNLTSAIVSGVVWNIGGSVRLTGIGSRLILYESAGPHAGSSVTFNIGGTLEVAGDGTSGGSARVELKSTSPLLYNCPEGIINLSGNFIHNGNVSISSASSGMVSPGMTINFVGSSPQIWSGIGYFGVTPPLFYINVNINNAAGVTLTAPRAINTNVNLTLVNGKLTTDATNLLTVSGTGTINGGSSSSFVNGPLAFANATAGAFSKTYPIGKGVVYKPLTLSLNQTAATSSSFTAEMFNSAPIANTLPGTLDAVSSVRYYTMTEGGSVPSAFTAGAVTLSYGADDGVTDAPNLRIAQGPVTGSGTWVDLGPVAGGSAGTITSTTPFTTFSNFVLANNLGGGNPLPVELTSFTAAAKDGVVELAWTTATETNNYGWDIELRKNSETSWEKIGFINGAGNSTSLNEYFFSDKFWKQNGSYLYRLKQIDYSGQFEYSNEVMVVIDVPQHYSLSQNYPNPFNPSTNIDYTLPADSKVTLAIYSLIGEKVADLVNEEQSSGYYSYQFSSRDLNLTSGVYIYKLIAISKSSELFSQSRKMILLK